MAPEQKNTTIGTNMEHTALPDEAETAATLLEIMAGAAASITARADRSLIGTKPERQNDSSLAFPPRLHQTMAPEASHQPFQVESPPPQVPNPLHNTFATFMQTAAVSATASSGRRYNSTSTSPKITNTDANKPATVLMAQPQTYMPNMNNNNFMMTSPTTYSFLQSLINQQQQASLAAAAASLSNNHNNQQQHGYTTTTTPNPLLLLAKNPLVPSTAGCNSSTLSAALAGGRNNQSQGNTTRVLSTKEQTDEMIRREEVDKALNSKPQRGRKRRNLNEEERQELTRTRNREHAKSTRERKKQRHMELLDTARLYQDLKRQQDLQGKRRDVVRRFVATRQEMLQQVLDNHQSNSSSPEEISTATVATTTVMDELILNRSDFRYHIRGQRGGADLDGVTLMGLFDRSFAALLPAQGSKVSYRYDDQCIALTERGDAQVECSICFGSRVIKTLHMTVSFAEATARILSVDIAFLQEESSERPPSLGNQVSHPSVVSLDDRYVSSLSRSKTEIEDGHLE